jgi:AcrR family transcriptional regulator
MTCYKTAAEKAAEWGVTPRYIQHLCREGKIDGAVKQAGVWFIPDDKPNPQKGLKSNEEAFVYKGTKERIFYNATKLFMEKGYENITLQDIAKASNIRQSAIYNHFKSKQSILDAAYGFFCHYAHINRPSLKDVEILIQKSSLLDLITKGFSYDYSADVFEQMFCISRIIVQRMTIDKRANDIFYEVFMEDGMNFVKNSLSKAVELGRLAPHDSYIMSLLIHCVRMHMLLRWLTKPPDEKPKKTRKEELDLHKVIAILLDDLNPPQTK